MYTRYYPHFEDLAWTANDSLGNPYAQGITLDLSGIRQGEANADWRRRIARGDNVTGVYFQDRCFLKEKRPGFVMVTMHETVYPFRDRTMSFNGVLTDSVHIPSHLSVSEEKAEAIALKKVYQTLNEVHSQMNGFAFVGELKDTVRMFANPMSSLLKFTSKYLERLEKSGRKVYPRMTDRERARFRKTMGDSYLEWAFGVKPLIADTKSIAESFARFNVEPELTPRSRIRAQGKDQSTTVLGTNDLGTTTWIRFDRTGKVVTNVIIKYSVGVRSTISAEFGSAKRLIDILGFTPENFIPAVWEVCPWSWLVDYFANIGDIISAGCANTSDVHWISRSVLYETTVEWKAACLSNRVSDSAKANQFDIRSFDILNGGGSCSFVRSTFSRTSPTSLGIPSLVTAHPFGNVGKVLNLAALLLQKEPQSASLWDRVGNRRN